MCEKPPLAASVTAGTALPRKDLSNGLTGLMAPQAPNEPAVSSSFTGSGYASQGAPIDLAKMAEQAQISPQQLLAAAQHLAAQQQQQQQQQLSAMSGFGVTPTMPAASTQPVTNPGNGLDAFGGMSQAALS